jgi:hypothetical protein
VITLSCDGELTYSHITASKRYPGGTEQLPKVGVIVNLNEGTVSFLGYVAHINSADAAYVQFGVKLSASSSKVPKLTSWARLIA